MQGCRTPPVEQISSTNHALLRYPARLFAQTGESQVTEQGRQRPNKHYQAHFEISPPLGYAFLLIPEDY
ncbi:hypothetical protein N9118_06815 [Akkermansiaceae bacterium]|nr:hypothetical protein [Akkermansiaceae bacterium]